LEQKLYDLPLLQSYVILNVWASFSVCSGGGAFTWSKVVAHAVFAYGSHYF